MNLFYLFVGLSGILITLLAFNVSRVRIKGKVRHGDGDNEILKIAIGAHSNSLEHIIPFALMIFVLQEQSTNYLVMQIMVFSFLIIRFLHAVGMIFSVMRIWRITAVLSILLSSVASILILVNLMK